MKKVALSIENLSVIYKSKSYQKKAVSGFSLDVQEGEFFGLLGPNGAGKTSLISSVTGLLDVEYGRIKVFGYEAGTVEAKRLIGVVPQELVHHGFFTVIEILQFFAGFYGVKDSKKRINFLLDRLALQEVRDRNVNQLSGGMKRRLLIAKAMVHAPKLLLLDEPSAGVDVELRTTLWEFLKELNDAGTSIILTTHYLEEAQRLCRRVAIMNHGRLLALDQTGDLIRSMADRIITVTLKSDRDHFSPDSYRGSQKLKIVGFDPLLHQFRVSALARFSIGEIFEELKLSLDDVQDLQMEEAELEKAFLRIVGDQKNAS